MQYNITDSCDSASPSAAHILQFHHPETRLSLDIWSANNKNHLKTKTHPIAMPCLSEMSMAISNNYIGTCFPRAAVCKSVMVSRLDLTMWLEGKEQKTGLWAMLIEWVGWMSRENKEVTLGKNQARTRDQVAKHGKTSGWNGSDHSLTFVLSINIDRDSWMLNSATDMVPTLASHLFVVISKSPWEGQRSWSGRTGILGLGEVGYMVHVQSFSLTCSPSLTKLVSSRTSELFSSHALKIHKGCGQRLQEAACWNSTVTLAVSSLSNRWLTHLHQSAPYGFECSYLKQAKSRYWHDTVCGTAGPYSMVRMSYIRFIGRGFPLHY